MYEYDLYEFQKSCQFTTSACWVDVPVKIYEYGLQLLEIAQVSLLYS